ncbi:class I SAM-dependent methyltransferase [Duganella levis]|uniref:Methyltransferase domain-containing protein n=1 Tax=Duganella levis TaxID=2692169 RepID=A0ABW9VWT7_9BURK|nr:class I SAM-dependent methyltransferase [Duganella levis]MYN26039.1 methyltransferase domain-containing protein [Duganella levis]
MEDASKGWEALAEEFATARSTIGSQVVRQWTQGLRPHSEVVDIGCGSGLPISQILVNAGFNVFGIDASPTLLSMFRHRFPAAPAACETVQTTTFFGQQFDGAIAIGLLFLLSEDDQRTMIDKVGQALRPGGRFLFSAPRVQCAWRDLQTGQPSLSLGEAEYQLQLRRAGMLLKNIYVDEGGNHYFDAVVDASNAIPTSSRLP